jgi:SAM-dependent methyltransferase
MGKRNAEFQDDRLAQIYENFNQFSEDENFWLNVIWNLNINHITDFGCGTWLLTQKLSELWYTMKWIDPAKPMLLQAMWKDKNNKIEYIHGGYEKLKGFETELVLMTSHVSQFITDENEWNELLQNSHKILKPGWYILFDSKNPFLKPWENYTREKYNRTKKTKFGDVNMQIEVWKISWNIITHNLHYNFLQTWEEHIASNTLTYKTKENLEQSLTENGFKIVKVYWDWEWQEYINTSSEMIFLAKKI